MTEPSNTTPPTKRSTTPIRRGQPPAGTVGAPATDPRSLLLSLGQVTLEKQAEAIKASFDKKVELLNAKKSQYFSHEGQVVDSRTDDALDIQLRACEAIDRMTGVLAPPASTKVTVEHTFKMPEWFMTADERQAALPVDATPQLEGPTNE